MPQIRRQTTGVGFAKETIWGTPVAASVLYPVTAISGQPTYEVILEAGLRGQGSRDFDAIQGGGHGEISLEGWVYPNELGNLLLPLMGSEAVTGSGPYVHTFKRGDTPGSITIEEALATGSNLALIYAGCRPGELAVSFDAGTGVLQYTATFMGEVPAIGTFAAPADTAEDGFAGWRGVVTSTGLTGILRSAEFTISRDIEVVHTARNDQDPFEINVGPLGIDGRMVIVAEDLADFTTWKTFTRQPFTITFDYGSGAGARGFKIIMTDCVLANGPFEIDRSNLGVTFGLPFVGIHNATDAGPLQVVLTNGKTGGY
jgi:hypothetical protein